MLYKITSRAISDLYGDNLGCGGLPDIQDLAGIILGFEKDLSNWQSTLPEPLEVLSTDLVLDSGFGKTQSVDRFNLILTLRFLNLQVLVHRPFLTRALDAVLDEPNRIKLPLYLTSIASEAMNTCAICSKDIIKITHTVLTETRLGKNYLGAWWYTLYFGTSCPLKTRSLTDERSHSL